MHVSALLVSLCVQALGVWVTGLPYEAAKVATGRGWWSGKVW